MGARLREYLQGAGRSARRAQSKAKLPSSGIVLGGHNLDLEVNAIVNRLNAFAEELTDPNRKLRALRAAGKLVAEAARNFAPEYPGTAIQRRKSNQAEHYRYNTPKIFRGLRAPKGKGRIVATYKAGHLKKAIQVLRLKRTERVYIGPVYDRKKGAAGGTFGTSEKNVDAFYAHMIFGSSRAFRKRVMLQGLLSADGAATKLIESRVNRFKKQLARKYKLNRA